MAVAEIPLHRESLAIPRKAVLAVALGISSILSVYIAAGATADRSPIVMPGEAKELPWPNDYARAFLISKENESLASCGKIDTFLNRWYDSASETKLQTLSITTYEGQYKSAMGPHEPSVAQLTANLAAATATTEVVLCQASSTESIIYLP